MESTYAYHVTPACNIESIFSDGLRPEIGVRSSELGEDHPRIYLFDCEQSLNDGLGNWLGEALEEFDQLAVLRINITGLSVNSEVEWELTYDSDIDPRLIEVLRFE